MTLTQKYIALKTKVGGNREMYGYEETFGMPREEQSHVTPPAAYQRRILSETEFAISLSAELGGKFDTDVNAALDVMLAEMDAEGALTKSAAAKAEALLMPLSAAAKEYKLIFAGHAHIDMNWMWSWHETVAATLATFRTMLDIMDEYPDFCFSQSQGAVYKIVEDFEPALMDRIKARIAEGRWEITASAWVETDKNMPSGESLLRHIEYTKNYLRDSWGVDPASLEIDFSPDTFGHSANIPEIDINGGVKYMYHCRALSGQQALYRWASESGSELIGYREQYWYNSGATPKPALGLIGVSKRQGGLKTGIAVYGVGDHGGGPTRRDVQRIIDMASWPVFPTIKFGTFREFFHEAETVREKLPLVDRELNVIFTGCYTTQSRIKRGNRHSEALLTDAFAMSAYAKQAAGYAVRNKALECAWRDVMFTHFHDILTGSCVQDSREHAMGLFSNSIAVANTEITNTMRVISDATDTSSIAFDDAVDSQAEGAGAGYGVDRVGGVPVPERGGGLTRAFTVFNPTAVNKAEPVEITVWDWTGDMRHVGFKDADGNPVDAHLIDHGLQSYWDHKYFRFSAFVEVPAYSYTTVVLYQKQNEGLYPVYYQPDYRQDGESGNAVLENEHIRAEFNIETGAMVSLIDKADGKEYIKADKFCGVSVIDTERSSSNAWHIGKYLAIKPISEIRRIGGGGRHFSYDAVVLGSKIKVNVSLAKNAHAVAYKLDVDWSEKAGDTVPVLAFMLPVAGEVKQYQYDVPCGVLRRAPYEQDVPALSYGAAIVGEKAAAIVTDSKYGYRGRHDGTLVSTLINSTEGPDPYPERGIHEITLYVGIFDADEKTMTEAATSLCHKLIYTSAKKHTGTLPLSGSFLSCNAPGAVVSAVECDGDAVLVRLYSVTDGDSEASVTMNSPVKKAELVNVMGNPVSGNVSASGNTVKFTVGKRAVVTVKITL